VVFVDGVRERLAPHDRLPQSHDRARLQPDSKRRTRLDASSGVVRSSHTHNIEQVWREI
jgi:hypothetical protein